MIRLAVLSLFCAVVAVYAARDWFKSLCGLIVLMGVLEHPDMPKTIGGIQGLNPWNLVFLCIALGWLAARRREGLRWDMPAVVNFMLIAYLGVILVGWYRMFDDRVMLYKETTASLISDYLINTVKWVFPALLLFDGCRTRERFKWAMFAIIGMYLLFAVQVIRWMPLSDAMQGEELAARSAKILMNEVGIHRVSMSMILAGAGWAVFSLRLLATTAKQRFCCNVGFLAVLYAQALTAGRTGYATWAIIGLLLCAMRWPKYLLLIPVIAAIIALAVPGAVDRMTEGFDTRTQQLDPTAAGDSKSNERYTVTAGRNIAWRYVIPKIGEAPFLGWGRLAMKRTGISDFLFNTWGESFPHPHNAYLELLLDNGWVGFLLIMPFYVMVLIQSIMLFRDQSNPLLAVTGAVCCSLVLALLVASLGSQSFYPVETTVGMWCSIGLMLRMWVERKRAIEEGTPAAIFASERVVPKRKLDITLWAEDEALASEASTKGEEEKLDEVQSIWRP